MEKKQTLTYFMDILCCEQPCVIVYVVDKLAFWEQYLLLGFLNDALPSKFAAVISSVTPFKLLVHNSVSYLCKIINYSVTPLT